MTETAQEREDANRAAQMAAAEKRHRDELDALEKLDPAAAALQAETEAKALERRRNTLPMTTPQRSDAEKGLTPPIPPGHEVNPG